MDGDSKTLWIALAATGFFLRATVSLHSYSGQNRPPMYGDYEAQRHWQEVTVNLPPTDWYRNTTDNDLLYWGLDYPPLTAYHSYLVGSWARRTHNESFVALHTSRGIGTEEHKHFMRNTVLLIDAALYIPALLFAVQFIRQRVSAAETTIPLLALAVLYPGQILIDNGHFQYNNISLALCTLAVVAIVGKATLLGAVLFCFALNYKQMELYHALPFFFYLLRDCFSGEGHSTAGRRIVVGVRRLTLLGATVVATFGVLWLPWIGSLESLGQLVHRIFPVARGIFEDKVSNVWCVVNVIVKLKNFPVATMALVCLLCTALAVLPSGLHLLLQKTATTTSFLYSLAATALGFFLFSFQVHEKSILLAGLPAVLLLPLEPLACFWFLQLSTFSMFPLLNRDGLTVAYLGLTLVSLTLPRLAQAGVPSRRAEPYPTSYDFLHIGHLIRRPVDRARRITLTVLFYGSLCGQATLVLAFLLLPPPEQLPFLYPLAISAYSCGHFVLFFLYFNYRQLCSGASSGTPKTNKMTHKKSK